MKRNTKKETPTKDKPTQDKPRTDREDIPRGGRRVARRKE